MAAQTKKIVLITGASSGMGEATVKLLLKEGHIVYGAARRLDRMEGIKNLGANILSMDVTDDASMVEGVDAIIKEQGRIDVLFNNAGYGSYGSVEEVPIDEGRRQLEVNVVGLARLTQLVIPHMRKEKSGLIINNTSIGGKIYSPLGAWYHATKHAIEGFSDCLRFELESFGINVVVIEPGGIQSEWAEVAKEHLVKVSGNGPYKNLMKPIMQAADNNDKAPSADVIANLVLKSMNTRKPKTRYWGGSNTFSMRLRALVSDRMFDRILRSFV